MSEESKNAQTVQNNRFTEFIQNHLEEIRNTFEEPDSIRLAIVIWDIDNPEDGYALTNASVELAMKELLYLSGTGQKFSGPERETIQ